MQIRSDLPRPATNAHNIKEWLPSPIDTSINKLQCQRLMGLLLLRFGSGNSRVHVLPLNATGWLVQEAT